MRPGALREATAKKAAAATRKLATMLSPAKRTAASGWPRSSSSTTLSLLAHGRRHYTPPGQDGPSRAPGPRPLARADRKRDRRHLRRRRSRFEEAQRRDPVSERTWNALVDGNKPQIEAIHALASRLHITVSIPINFIHVLEHIWKAAWSFFEHSDPAAEEWVACEALKILDGKAAQLAACTRRRATAFGYSPAELVGAMRAPAT